MGIYILISNYMTALVFTIANRVAMKCPSYFLRHWYLKSFCNVKIGKNSSICTDSFITGKHIKIGSNSVINRFCYLDGRVPLTIGDNVNISHYTHIQTLSHNYQCPNFSCICKPVIIESNVWIGARAIILPGVTVGEGAVIGAGAVVTKSVPPYKVAAGNPARIINERSKDIKYETKYFPLFDTDIQ
ncbi:MAG: acyltransferase [Chthoniobacterales bacterium]|nr:acyltransferase [Chthoniobacterales bacterium]